MHFQRALLLTTLVHSLLCAQAQKAPARPPEPKEISPLPAGVNSWQADGGLYKASVVLQERWFNPSSKVLLQMTPAEVTVNGKAVEVFSKDPFRMDITPVAKDGVNVIEARSTSQPGPASVLAENPAPGMVANIPANYDELKVGAYTLPDPLKFPDGKPVRNAREWNQRRRPELVRAFEEHQYGATPPKPAGMTFDVFDKGTPALDGKALRRQVTVYFTGDKAGPKKWNLQTNKAE